jgi:hypothetical protein
LKIWCCSCESDVEARLTDGSEIYPHREDLYSMPFWKCDKCGNYVGCHHKTSNRTNPLGYIPTQELKAARLHIHGILDPLWKTGGMSRGSIYSIIAKGLGKDKFHTAEIKTVDEARKVYRIVKKLNEERINES